MSGFSNEIWVVPSPSMPSGGKGLLEGITKPVKLNVASLRDNIKSFLESMNQMLADVPTLAAPYTLDEIEVKIEVNAEGNIQLVGGVKAGATGGITFRMKRQ